MRGVSRQADNQGMMRVPAAKWSRHPSPERSSPREGSRLARLEPWLPIVFSGLAFVSGLVFVGLVTFAAEYASSSMPVLSWVITASITIYVLSLAAGIGSLIRLFLRGSWSALWSAPAVVIMMSPVLLAFMSSGARYS
jgi:hypothetical protein